MIRIIANYELSSMLHYFEMWRRVFWYKDAGILEEHCRTCVNVQKRQNILVPTCLKTDAMYQSIKQISSQPAQQRPCL
jgi:hypothetical protein